MSNKKCMIFETLGQVSNLSASKTDKDEVRLHGVFGVCGIRNRNNRIYNKENYGKMVESLQKTIATEGCLGELEHPNSMNINLENVSHKIESIEMKEDGTIEGTILLLNTPKGKIAKAIVESGVPLYISSRGAGTITNEGLVTLSSIKTYDLVGTPGFSQAKLTLKENQQVESLNENLEDGPVSWVIYENDDSKEDPKEDEPKDGDSKEGDSKEPDDSSKDDNGTDDNGTDDNNKINNNEDISMKDLKDAIDKLTQRVTSLESQLHVAQENYINKNTVIDEVKSLINKSNSVLCEAIEKWVVEEFSPEVQNWIVEECLPSVDSGKDIKAYINETILPGVQKWVIEEFAPEVQNWVVEEFAPEVQNWIVEEFSPEVQNWVVEEFAPEVQNWIVEEYSPEVQNWIVEEYSPEVQNWIVEEYSPAVQNWLVEEYSESIGDWINEELKPEIESNVNENISKYLSENNTARLNEIDSLLESIDSTKEVAQLVKEEKENNQYKGIYCVENMPAQYRASWNMISENKKNEIIRNSRMYDFTKAGVLESFWNNIDFNETPKDDSKKKVNESMNVLNDYHQGIVAQMNRLRK